MKFSKNKKPISYPSSLHDFIGKEGEQYIKFRNKHYKKCNNGHDYIVRLKSSGIGESIEVTCPRCGETKNITDISKW